MKKILNLLYNILIALVFLFIFNFIMIFLSGVSMQSSYFIPGEKSIRLNLTLILFVGSLCIMLILCYIISKEIFKSTYNRFTDALSVLLCPLAISAVMYFQFQGTLKYFFMWFADFVEIVYSSNIKIHLALFVSMFSPLLVMFIGMHIKRNKIKS